MKPDKIKKLQQRAIDLQGKMEDICSAKPRKTRKRVFVMLGRKSCCVFVI